MSSSAQPDILIRRIVWPLVWAVVFLALIEVTLELRAAGRGFTTHLFGQPRQEAMTLVAESNQPVYGPTSGFPFRSRVIERQRKQGAVRIWIASSSHAEDIRMAAEDVFPAVLERKLNQQGIHCQVLNASRAGMTLQQNAAELTALAATWQPDIVIAYQMSNDLVSGFHANVEATSATTKTLPQGLPKLTGGADQFVEQTTLYELLKSNVTARISQSKILRDEPPESSEQCYFEQLDLLQEAATASDAKFFVCTFGFSHRQSPLPVDYELVLLKTLPELRPAAWADVIGHWNQGIRGHFPDQTLDVAAVVYGQPELFRDPVHFSKRGHEVIGHAIASELLSRHDLSKSVDTVRKGF